MTLIRADIDKQYGITLTDNQWRILLEEIEGKEEYEDVEDVVADTIENIDYLESEYAWWEARVAEAQNK